MSIKLNQILSLVGKLDDAPGPDTARERFRQFLHANVQEIGQIGDHIDECLRTAGDQYNRALQDLVNYLGHFLGFEVTYGRYQGVKGQIGFDGRWKSPTGFNIIIEVKTTDVYAIKTKTLVGYIDDLISAKTVSDWDSSMGLYVIGRYDPDLRQLENNIVAEKRTHQLRIVSATSLLSLAELMNEYDVNHEDVLAVLRPSGPGIDPVVGLITRLLAPRETDQVPPQIHPSSHEPAEEEAACWLSPVKGGDEHTAEAVVQTLVGEEKIYAFGDKTPGRKHLRPGDRMCFYATGKGVIAHAKVASVPERKPDRRIRHIDVFPWVFSLQEPVLYVDEPVVIDASLRAKLDAFEGRNPDKPWSWFVQATCKLTSHDFQVLTRFG